MTGSAGGPTMKEVAARRRRQPEHGLARGQRRRQVRADLAERVHEAVEMLGYRRDHTASTLRRADRTSASIGLVIDDVGNPFFSAVHRGVEEVARDRGVLVVRRQLRRGPRARARARRRVRRARRRRADHGARRAPTRATCSASARAGVGARLRRPPAAADRRRRRALRQRRRRAAAVAHLIAARAPPDRLPRRPAAIYTAAERLRGYREALAARAAARRRGLVRTELARAASAATPRRRELLEEPGAADRALHAPEPDHDRRRAGARRARPARHARRSSASTTSPLGDAVQPGADGRRAGPGRAGPHGAPSGCSRGSTATRRPRARWCCRCA